MKNGNICDQCIHREVCKFRESFTQIVEESKIIDSKLKHLSLDPVSDDDELFKVDFHCKHYLKLMNPREASLRI